MLISFKNTAKVYIVIQQNDYVKCSKNLMYINKSFNVCFLSAVGLLVRLAEGRLERSAFLSQSAIKCAEKRILIDRIFSNREERLQFSWSQISYSKTEKRK